MGFEFVMLSSCWVQLYMKNTTVPPPPFIVLMVPVVGELQFTVYMHFLDKLLFVTHSEVRLSCDYKYATMSDHQ